MEVNHESRNVDRALVSRADRERPRRRRRAWTDRAVLAGVGQTPRRAAGGASPAHRRLPAHRQSWATAEIRVRGAAVGRCGSVHTRHDRLRRVGDGTRSDVHRRSGLDSRKQAPAECAATSYAAGAYAIAVVLLVMTVMARSRQRGFDWSAADAWARRSGSEKP